MVEAMRTSPAILSLTLALLSLFCLAFFTPTPAYLAYLSACLTGAMAFGIACIFIRKREEEE